MAAPAPQAAASKSAKKKAAKAQGRTESPAPSTESAPTEKVAEAQDDAFESPYIKELQKNIRNTAKKLTNASKTDTLLSQHAGKSLDELVAERILNTDQKTQILKKPALQAALAQYEEQLAQYQKVHEQYQTRAAADKAEWAKALEKTKEEALSEVKAEFEGSLKSKLLVLSQFLRLAAYRREESQEPESDESQAIEGVLLAIYSGDDNAVSAMEKLIEGSDDQIFSVPGEQLQTTYASVKSLAQSYNAPGYTEAAAEAQPAAEIVSDPTIANEAATEIAAGDGILTNGHELVEPEPASNGLANADVADEAANAVAESHWDTSNQDISISQEWVDVAIPAEPAEPEVSAEAATPDANKQSWADDHPDPVTELHQPMPTMDSTKSSAIGDDRIARAAEDVDAVVATGAAEAAIEEMAVDVAEDAVTEVIVAESLSEDLAATSRRAPARGSWEPSSFSSNVLAASAVLGVDLGTEYIKAALVKPGIPLEIVLTKDSRRKETSAVAFKPSKGAVAEGQYPERNYGADAMAIAARFPGEVYPNLKPLLGLPVGDAIVQEYAARHPALKLQAHATRGTAAFKTETLTAEEEAWMVEELLAMELQSIQKNAEVTAGGDSSIRSIVLTVPPFYTTEEKRALQMAAELAGFKVLSLVSEGLAVGLNYATSRQFPNINEGAKPEYHMVFDMGAGSTTATVMRFQSRTIKDVGKYNKTVQEIQVLGSGWDRNLGGDSLNSLIVDDMISQFVESKGAQKISATAEQVQSHGRTVAKLSKEAERLRHVLSANQNTQASFEGLYEDVDFKYKIARADFEAMAEAHVDRVGVAIREALKAANLEIGDLTSVILHGGATRTPFVQKALEKALGSGDKIRTNVNSDEAAVFGAAFRAAELSPSFRVKEIRISEGAMFPAGITWKASNGKVQRQRLWTASSPLNGPAKEITFTEQEDFTGSFYQQVDTEDKIVKSFSTNNLTATVAALKEKYPTCADTGIQFKVAVKLRTENGEVEIVKAVVECEAEVAEKEGFVDGVKNLFGFGKKDQKPLGEGEKDADASSDAEAKTEEANSDAKSSSTTSTKSGEAAQSTDAAKEEVKKKQIVSIPVEVSLEKAGTPQLTKAEWTKAKDRLKAFAASDKARVQREEALNQLEAFTYKVRDLVDNEAFISASTEEERQALSEKASEASDWLYEEGDAATKADFVAKLKALQDLVGPIQNRLDEAERRPGLITDLRNILNTTDVFINTVRAQISAYDEWKATASTKEAESATSSAAAETTSGDFEGLEDDDAEEKPAKEEVVPPLHNSEEMDGLEVLYKETLDWLNKLEVEQADVPLTKEPVLKVSELVAKRDALDKASLDLALKSFNQYQKNKPKKPTKSKKAKKQDKTKSGEKATPTFEFPEGSVPLSNEELEELVKQYMKEEEDSRKNAEDTAKPEHDEL
ncbi:hypothetical protein TrVFT333_005034 [Trichoderma virens FT-333]|nr:hypothetical protein TrVFT333_005034 [Trichoderma virens FT-333]